MLNAKISLLSTLCYQIIAVQVQTYQEYVQVCLTANCALEYTGLYVGLRFDHQVVQVELVKVMIAFALKDWKGTVITLIQFELAVITLTSVWIMSVGRQLGHGALTMIHVTKLWERSAQIFFMIAHVMPREYFISR